MWFSHAPDTGVSVRGAFLPPLMGLVGDRTSVQVGFVVPLAALAYITWVAFANLSRTGAAERV